MRVRKHGADVAIVIKRHFQRYPESRMMKYPGLMESFKQLIATPSVSSVDPALDQSNRAVVDLLAGWLEDLGLKVELMPVAGSVVNGEEKVNLIACLGEGEGGLVLSGHTDTVPYDEYLWQQDPFQLTERDNKLYGLGSTDMKVFFPLALDLLSQIDAKKLNQPLFLLATSDEESTMAGALTLAASGKKLGRHALIGEPTGLQPINLHKGVMMESIRITGKAGHSSDPALGNNALDGMHKVMHALMLLREDLQTRYHNPAFAVPYPTMNFGSLHGGDNPNRICAECELKLDVRLMPGMEIEATRQKIRKAAQDAIANTGLNIQYLDLYEGLPPMHTDDQSAIVKLAEKLSDREVGSVAFGTEGPYLNSMGMETVVMGPGDIDVAHQANEYISLDRIEPMSKILTGLVQTLCIDKK